MNASSQAKTFNEESSITFYAAASGELVELVTKDRGVMPSQGGSDSVQEWLRLRALARSVLMIGRVVDRYLKP